MYVTMLNQYINHSISDWSSSVMRQSFKQTVYIFLVVSSSKLALSNTATHSLTHVCILSFVSFETFVSFSMPTLTPSTLTTCSQLKQQMGSHIYTSHDMISKLDHQLWHDTMMTWWHKTFALGLSAWKSRVSGNMRSLNAFLMMLVSLTLTTARLSSS